MPKRIVVVKKGPFCKDTHNVLHKITHGHEPRTHPAYKAMLKRYPQLRKAKGIDFHSLDHARFTIPMMLEVGVPVHEIIIGRLSVRGGREKLLREVMEISHARGTAHMKLNFRSLVNHGVPVHTLFTHHVPYGLLMLEGFTREELVEGGYDGAKIDHTLEVHANSPTLFRKSPIHPKK